jgi:hypothetical protein
MRTGSEIRMPPPAKTVDRLAKRRTAHGNRIERR